MAKPTDDALKRLGGGRWQTRDERFTIEPQSGTWAVVDAEQTDDLGLPLVRGPFPSLTAAKAAIAEARADAPPAPAGKGRISASKREASSSPDEAADDAAAARPAGESAKDRPAKEAATKGRSTKERTTKARAAATKEAPSEPPDPSWFGALEPDDRRRARRLLRHLTAQGVRDAEGLVRRDLAGDVPALATHAVKVALEALGPDASPAEVARLLADGRDDALEVRWRLVDDRGRRIDLDR